MLSGEDHRLYVEWTEFFRTPFEEEIFLHYDLYELSHRHREEHDRAASCTLWPSPPYRTPMWFEIARRRCPQRYLEIGSGLGYTAAVMATTGGPNCHVDAIEIDPVHCEIAKGELMVRALADRVSVHTGDWRNVILNLCEPYDIIFADAGAISSRQIENLSHGETIWVDKERFARSIQKLVLSYTDHGQRIDEAAIQDIRNRYVSAVRDALVSSRG